MTIGSIIRQFKSVFDRSPWYGESLMGKLSTITAQEAFFKPSPEIHSIFEILQHMLAWRNYALHILEGDMEYDIDINSSKDWPRPPEPSEEAWQQLIVDFKHNQEHLINKLSASDDSVLTETVPRREFTYHHMLEGMIHHDIYHLGQIGILKKQLSMKEAV